MLSAIALARRERVSHAAAEAGCGLLWSENLGHQRRYGPVMVRDPFR